MIMTINRSYSKMVNLTKHVWEMNSAPIFKIRSIDLGDEEDDHPIVHIINLKSDSSIYKTVEELYESNLLKHFSYDDIALIGYTHGKNSSHVANQEYK